MFAAQTRDLSHIELARSDNISSSSKARTYRVCEAHISTERKTRARIRGENPSILALSVCKGVGAKPIYAFDQTNAMLALLSKCQFSAKDITLFERFLFLYFRLLFGDSIYESDYKIYYRSKNVCKEVSDHFKNTRSRLFLWSVSII